MAQESRKSELIFELERARENLAANLHGLRRDFRIVHRVKTGFERYRFVWLGGAIVLGLLLARLPGRKKKVTVERRGRREKGENAVIKTGLFLGALKFAFDVARPVLTRWLTRRVSEYAQSRMRRSNAV
ncbi:MAG: hypothetical protein QOE70_5527 [Chthoniobacter sp.]|jgi:hypothetical protein|nr:hypothetical protein [Chthoniobacter sp.]